jgi:hypothetical protein
MSAGLLTSDASIGGKGNGRLLRLVPRRETPPVTGAFITPLDCPSGKTTAFSLDPPMVLGCGWV